MGKIHTSAEQSSVESKIGSEVPAASYSITAGDDDVLRVSQQVVAPGGGEAGSVKVTVRELCRGAPPG